MVKLRWRVLLFLNINEFFKNCFIENSSIIEMILTIQYTRLVYIYMIKGKQGTCSSPKSKYSSLLFSNLGDTVCHIGHTK